MRKQGKLTPLVGAWDQEPQRRPGKVGLIFTELSPRKQYKKDQRKL